MNTFVNRTCLTSIASVLCVALAGCATAPPPRELLDARAAYNRASTGPAARSNPADVLTAKQELDKAEAMYADKGDAPETKDSAYVAERKAERAEAVAKADAAKHDKEEAEKEGSKYTSDSLTKVSGELVSTKQALDKERTAREEAEKRAAIAMADLQKIAAVKKDDRGLVITLSGGVLFKTDKYELLPGAMVQLNQVSDALTKNSPDAKIRVEGYTDSQGNESHNLELSQKRAESVATYLVGRGIAKDRVTSAGLGSSKPVSDNTSTEGRAQNRRVEIVVDNGSAK